MHDHDARSDGADRAGAARASWGRSDRPRRARPGGALATLAALGLVVAVSIGVAAAQGSGQDDNVRLAQTVVTV